MRLVLLLPIALLAGATAVRADDVVDQMQLDWQDWEIQLQNMRIQQLENEQRPQPDPVQPVEIPEPEGDIPNIRNDLNFQRDDNSASQKIDDLKQEIEGLREDIRNAKDAPSEPEIDALARAEAERQRAKEAAKLREEVSAPLPQTSADVIKSAIARSVIEENIENAGTTLGIDVGAPYDEQEAIRQRDRLQH
jgi:hypothetical protein